LCGSLFVSDLLSVSESLYRCLEYLRWQPFIELLKLPHSSSFQPYVLRTSTTLPVAMGLLIYACHIVQSVGILTFLILMFRPSLKGGDRSGWNNTTWLAVSFPHTPAIVHITVSSVQLRVCHLTNLTAVVIHGMKLFFDDVMNSFVCFLLVLLKFLEHSKLLLKIVTVSAGSHSFWTLWLQYTCTYNDAAAAVKRHSVQFS
jgi:hypothetical protein